MASTPATFTANASPDGSMTSDWRTVLLLVFIGQLLAMLIVCFCLLMKRVAAQRKGPRPMRGTHSVRSKCNPDVQNYRPRRPEGPFFNKLVFPDDRKTLGSCDTLPTEEFEYVEVTPEANTNAQRAANSNRKYPAEMVRDLNYVYKAGYTEKNKGKYLNRQYDYSDSEHYDSWQPSPEVSRRGMGKPPYQP